LTAFHLQRIEAGWEAKPPNRSVLIFINNYRMGWLLFGLVLLILIIRPGFKSAVDFFFFPTFGLKDGIGRSSLKDLARNKISLQAMIEGQQSR
jgi:hypothetical protein